MSNEQHKPCDAPEAGQDWDQAVSRRLRMLATTPMDLGRLEASIRAEIPPPVPHRAWRITQRRPLRAVAASFVALAILSAVLVNSASGPVMASAQQMAQVHEDLIAGRTPAVRVDSIDAANKAIAGQWREAPGLPEAPCDHVMACCLKSVKGRRVACVLMDRSGTPVTMTVASAGDMGSPASPTLSRNGVVYHVQAVNDLNMVMTERHGRWVCLIGRLANDRLMDLAEGLRF